jgi:hypothetical protein
MGFRRYKATVTYLSSELKLRAESVTVELVSREPVTVSDPALLNALRGLPANSVITSVQLSEAA